MSNEHCPHCGHDLRDGEVPRDDPAPGSYGWDGPGDPPRYYSRTIGVEIPGVYDGILFWQCPDCHGRWHRWPEGHPYRQRAEVYVPGVPVV